MQMYLRSENQQISGMKIVDTQGLLLGIHPCFNNSIKYCLQRWQKENEKEGFNYQVEWLWNFKKEFGLSLWGYMLYHCFGNSYLWFDLLHDLLSLCISYSYILFIFCKIFELMHTPHHWCLASQTNMFQSISMICNWMKWSKFLYVMLCALHVFRF